MGEVLMSNGFEFGRGMSSAGRENALERTPLLPAWPGNLLIAANLDNPQVIGNDFVAFDPMRDSAPSKSELEGSRRSSVRFGRLQP
jgi:hypothetical protein